MPQETEQVQQEQIAESTAQAEVTEQPAAPATAEPAETPLEPEQPGQEQEPSSRGGVQRRIDELTKKAHLAAAEVEFWKAKAIGEKKPEASQASKPTAEPNLADFEDYDTYYKAVRAWDREQIKTELDAKFQEQKVQSEWADREAPVRTAHTDYKEVSNQALDIFQKSQGPGFQAIAQAIQYSEAGPELLYYLGQNTEELQELGSLYPTQALLALGSLKARLTDKNPSGAKAVPQHTRAPKPPTPIKTVSAADDGELRDDLPPDQWAARFRKKRERSA